MTGAGVEKIFGYQEKINWYLDRIQAQIDAYALLIDRIADLEKEVRRSCMAYLKEFPDNKKHAFEKVEMLACSGESQKDDYLELVWLRHKDKSMQHIMEATQSGLSATQSLMKYDRPIYGGNGQGAQ
jgi:hypothetical protein